MLKPSVLEATFSVIEDRPSLRRGWIQDMGHTGPNRLWLVAHTLASWSAFNLVCYVTETGRLAVFPSDQIAKGHFSTSLAISCGHMPKF